MIKFQTNVCPLCDKVLKFHQVAKVNIYSCPTSVDGRSHYEVEYDKKSTIQHIYVGDWGIDNFDNATRSRVYKKLPNTSRWSLLTEVTHLNADTEENMLRKLSKLFPSQ